MYFQLLWWWAVTSLLGWAAFAALWQFFPTMRDRGYGVGRYLGLLLVGFAVWLPGSFVALPRGPAVRLLAAVVLGGLAVWSFRRNRSEVLLTLKQNRTAVILTEVLVLASFLILGTLRSYVPQVNSFAEKIPDQCFITASYEARSFPPEDTWASGETINYFYYGHYLVATLCHLTGTHPRWGYNLGLVAIFALLYAASYSLGYNLTRKPFLSLLFPATVGIMGNLDGFVQKLVLRNSGYDWWRSSRVMVRSVWRAGEWVKVDETINEFPFWSFVLGDVHAHVLATPLLIVNLFLLYVLLNLPREEARLRRCWPLVLLAGLGIGCTPCTNFWEVPTIACLTVGVLGLRLLREWREPAVAGFSRQALHEVTLFVGVGAASLLLYSPFHLAFKRNQADGIGWVRPEMMSAAEDFFTIFGFFVFVLLSFLFHLGQERARESRLPEVSGLLLGGLLLVGWQIQSIALPTLLVLLLGYALIAVLLPLNRAALFASLLVVVGAGAVLACEFVFIEDWYGGALDRMNTVFKFYFQGWVLFAVASSYLATVLLQIFQGSKGLFARFVWPTAFGALLAVSFIFTLYGPGARSGNYSLKEPTLDGIAYMEREFPGDFVGIPAVLANVPSGELVLEAEGEAFSQYGRVAAFTGRPTVLGWGHHQSLWRDPKGAFTRERETDVKEAFNSPNPQRFLELAHKYDIRWVYVGHWERKRYDAAGLAKFEQLGELVFNERDTRLYRLRR